MPFDMTTDTARMPTEDTHIRDDAGDANVATMPTEATAPAQVGLSAARSGGCVARSEMDAMAERTPEATPVDTAGERTAAPRRETTVLTLRDGRRLTLRRVGPAGERERGDAARVPMVLALHGTPGSRLKFLAAEAGAHDLGLTLLSVDRWGYGGSDRHPRPSLRAFADDMAEMLDSLAIERVAVVGVSGGGPFAAAVAATHPARVASLALVAPVGPIAEAPTGAGFRPFHRFCFTVLPRVPGATAAVFHIYRALLKAAPLAAAGLISARADAVDRDIVLRPDVRARLAETFGLGLAPGVSGPVTDLALFSRRWDIDLGAITARTRIWLGSNDRNVPVAPVEALAAGIPGAELIRLADQGHYWIALYPADVLRWIAADRATIG